MRLPSRRGSEKVFEADLDIYQTSGETISSTFTIFTVMFISRIIAVSNKDLDTFVESSKLETVRTVLHVR